MSELGRFLSLTVIDCAVPFVHESASNGSGPRIEVLVCAPYGKINVPVVQFELDVSNCVSQIPAYSDTTIMRILGDGRNVEQLTAVVLNSWQK